MPDDSASSITSDAAYEPRNLPVPVKPQRESAENWIVRMFRTLFGEGYPFSYDFRDLARYYAAYRRLIRRRVNAEMRIDDGAKFGRYLQPANERRRGVRRHRQNDAVIFAERDAVAAEIQRLHTLAAKLNGAKLMFHPHHGAAQPQIFERRLD